MALFVETPDRANLLALIYEAIGKKNQKGGVATWETDSRNYFTHTPADGQWKGEAYFQPVLPKDEPNILKFCIIKPSAENISVRVYSIYHGRFAEMLLAHFDKEFTKITTSALATVGDVVK
jgi:hypothetical protein